MREKSESLFFSYNMNENKIEINFYEWKYYGYSLCNKVASSLIVYLNDYYMTGVVFYCLVNSNSRPILTLMLGLFGYMIFARFKKGMQTVAMEERKASALSVIFKGIVIALFFFEFVAELLSRLGGVSFTYRGQYYTLEDSLIKTGSGTNLMIIYTLLFYDLLTIKNFVLERRRLNRTKEIHQKFSDICHAQSINERKIFDRVSIIMAKDRLENQIDHYLRKGILKSKADLNYYKVDVRIAIKEARLNFLSKYMESFKLGVMSITEGIYNKIISNTNIFESQDLLYLLAKVSMMDQGIITSCDLSLTEYLSGDLDLFDSVYNDIVTFYTNLNNKEPSEYELYKTKMKEFEIKVLDHDVHVNNEFETFSYLKNEDSKEEEPLTATVSIFKSQLAIRKKLQKKSSRAFPVDRKSWNEIGMSNRPSLMGESPGYPGSSAAFGSQDDDSPFGEGMGGLRQTMVGQKKKKGDLVDAADTIFNFLKARRPMIVHENFLASESIAIFKLSKENCTVVFNDIIKDGMQNTKGYMMMSFADVFPMAIAVLTSNLEVIVALFVTVSLFLTGGLLSTAILGMLFFRVILEEYGGRAKEWELIAIVFFVQFVLKILANWGAQLKFIGIDFSTYLVFMAGMIEEDWELKLETLALTSILWQIQLSQRKVANAPEANVLINHGVTMARVGIY